jgi:hypothetical protein
LSTKADIRWAAQSRGPAFGMTTWHQAEAPSWSQRDFRGAYRLFDGIAARNTPLAIWRSTNAGNTFSPNEHEVLLF